MSNREDYLDSLLRSVTARGEDYASDLLESEDDFLEGFDQDVADMDETSFLNDFELGLSDIDLKEGLDLSEDEMDGAGLDGTELDGSDLDSIDNLDGFMVDTMSDDTPEDSKSIEPEKANGNDTDSQLKDLDEMLAAAMNSDPAEDDGLSIDTMSSDDFNMFAQDKSMYAENDIELDPMEADDKDILDILTDMPEDDDLADIGNMLKADENHEEISSDEIEALEDLADKKDLEASQEENANKKGSRKKKEKENAGGFLKKLSLLLFGEDEDVEVPESQELKSISEENMEVLKDLEKEKKKKEKQEKQELKKQEKQEKKEQKAQAALEKKALKEQKRKDRPEEVDHSPPLPRVPVILIFLLSISIILLVILAGNLSGYTVTISDAKEKMAGGNYIEAYEALAGIKVKEIDTGLYEQARLTALLQREEDGYRVYIEQGLYAEALDALIGGVGKYHKYKKEAKTAGVTAEYEKTRKRFTKQLKEQFALNEQQARELFKIDDRQDYTRKIHSILSKLHLI